MAHVSRTSDPPRQNDAQRIRRSFRTSEIQVATNGSDALRHKSEFQGELTQAERRTSPFSRPLSNEYRIYLCQRHRRP